jgi:hypothetical protein
MEFLFVIKHCKYLNSRMNIFIFFHLNKEYEMLTNLNMQQYSLNIILKKKY